MLSGRRRNELTRAHELGSLTRYFYGLAYLGCLAPRVAALEGQWGDALLIVDGITVLCMASLCIVMLNSRKYLPHGLEQVDAEAGSRA